MSEHARLFYELYVAHREALTGEFSDAGPRNPETWEWISELNRAALILTFDALEGIEALDDEEPR